MKEMHIRTDRTLFDYIVSSLLETTSPSLPFSPLASSPVAFSPTRDMLDGTSPLVIPALFEAGRGTYIKGWSAMPRTAGT